MDSKTDQSRPADAIVPGSPEGGPGAPDAIEDDRPLRALLRLALPTVVTMSSFTLMQFIDKLMVSRVDAMYVGAQGNGGLISFVPISIAMGLVTVVNSFVSQNLGANRPDRGPAYAWNAMWLAMVYWALVIIPMALSLPWIFAAFRDANLPEAELARVTTRDNLSIGYAQILMFGACLTLASRAASQFFYGMHKPSVVLIAGLTGNLTNFVCNSILIYGPTQAPPTGIAVLDAWFNATASIAQAVGLPRMGLSGAAVGTVIGTFVEFLIPAVVFLSPSYNRRFRTRAAWRPSLLHIKDLFRVGWAPGLMFGNEMICWGLFMVYMVGRFGTEHSTAGWIAHQYMSMSFMPAVGISVAVTAMVGKCMGAKRPDLAASRAWMGVRVAVVYMLICAVCFVVFADPMARLFLSDEQDPETLERLVGMVGMFLLLTAAFQLFDAFAITLVGALRGAGDTAWPGIATLVASWTVIVGGGLLIMHLAPGLGSVGPWIAASAYVIILSLLILGRFLQGSWKSRTLVRE
jgi:MATE family multidrug resistance protein